MRGLSKTEAEREIREFFLDIKEKTPKEIKKIKKLAMSYNIPLKESRKKFCKKCCSPKLKIKGVKKKVKTVECENCGKLMRWKI